jgi:hypothetical protein
LPDRLTNKFAKSTFPRTNPIGGEIMSSTNDAIIFPESCADDYSDGQIEDVPPHYKFFAFLQRAQPTRPTTADPASCRATVRLNRTPR